MERALEACFASCHPSGEAILGSYSFWPVALAAVRLAFDHCYLPLAFVEPEQFLSFQTVWLED
jgi:hypothetical protein